MESLSELESISTNGQLNVYLTELFNSFKVATDDFKVEVGDLQDELQKIKKCFWSPSEGIFGIS